MKVFTVTITQGNYEERTNRVLIFSSSEKLNEWRKSYKTPADSYASNGEEYGFTRCVEVDSNRVAELEFFPIEHE